MTDDTITIKALAHRSGASVNLTCSRQFWMSMNDETRDLFVRDELVKAGLIRWDYVDPVENVVSMEGLCDD